MTPYTVRTGLCKVSGKHLSEAPNAPTFEKIHEECQADARAILRASLTACPADRKALLGQIDRPDELTIACTGGRS